MEYLLNWLVIALHHRATPLNIADPPYDIKSTMATWFALNKKTLHPISIKNMSSNGWGVLIQGQPIYFAYIWHSNRVSL